MKKLILTLALRPLQLLCLMLSSLVFCQAVPSFAQTKPKSGSAKEVKAPQEDLHTAILKGNLAVLKQHIAAGSDLNVKEQMGGSSPLIMATLLGKTDMAKALIDAGANLNLKNNDGSTALHIAAFFCRPDIVKMLLAKRADKTIKNNYGSTAYAAVTPPFKEVKGVYDMMGKMLAPIGLKLDYAYIEATRPKIAAMLK